MKRLEDLEEAELAVLMETAARGLELIFSKLGVEKPMFALIVFNDPKIGQYISNCRREEMTAALREVAERIEKRKDVTR